MSCMETHINNSAVRWKSVVPAFRKLSILACVSRSSCTMDNEGRLTRPERYGLGFVGSSAAGPRSDVQMETAESGQFDGSGPVQKQKSEFQCIAEVQPSDNAAYTVWSTYQVSRVGAGHCTMRK